MGQCFLGALLGLGPQRNVGLDYHYCLCYCFAFKVYSRIKKCFSFFNMSTLIAYSSVLMTYFGVNFYLSGLHSYAKGDPAPIPNGVYYTVAIVLTVILLAYLNRKRIEKLLAA